MTGALNASNSVDFWEQLSKASFEKGGEDGLDGLRAKYPSRPQEGEQRKKLEQDWRDLLSKIQIQTGTLLKTDTVSFLLGAGASKACGGVLIGKVPLAVECALLKEGISGTQVPRFRKWLQCFYLGVARALDDPAALPIDRQWILKRCEAIIDGDSPNELLVNYEALLSLLHRWRSALPHGGGRIRLTGTPTVDLSSKEIDECLYWATRALVDACRLPAEGADPTGFRAFTHLMRKVLTRPLNLKRVNLFTLNYDTLMEQAADSEGIVLMDGFIGTVRRVFRPESYDQDLYFPAETTEGRVHRLDRVAHLYKLHGSITWRADKADWDNPYGIVAGADGTADDRQILIYPTPAKFEATLGMPYAELFRRFATAAVRPQSTLFVIGYGFGDEHVNTIIRQALAVPSFTLVIVDPNPVSDFVARLKSQHDRRIWIMSGETFGTFNGFVEHILPDLRDEEVRRKVMTTWRALGPSSADEGVGKAVDD